MHKAFLFEHEDGRVCCLVHAPVTLLVSIMQRAGVEEYWTPVGYWKRAGADRVCKECAAEARTRAHEP